MEEKITAILHKYSTILIVLALTIFAMLPLLQPGFFPMHDDEQVGRLYSLDLALKAGHFPPRISPELGFGYGYPLFNFYPSFVYYVGQVFVLLGFSYIVSIKLMIAVGFLLAAFFMYLFVKDYFGKLGGIVSAVAYTYAPYHAVDVYVRGALPEFWSFVFIPALFWGFKKIAENEKSIYIVLTAFFTAGLILTHNLVALMSSIFLGIYFLYLLIKSSEKKRFIIQLVIAGILGLLLSAYFWIPSYVERGATMIGLLTTELADYRQHFVYLRQLWNSPWGYGGSLYGLYDGLSFQIGKIHILFSFLIFGASLIYFRKKKVYMESIILFFGLFVLSVFLMTFYSKFIWDSIPQLSYIQFPWRFLLFASFTSSFLLGGLFLLPFTQKQKIILAVLCSSVIILFNQPYFKPEKYFTSVTDTDYTRRDVIRWRTSIMAFEYVPLGVGTRTSPVGTTIIDIDRNEVASSASKVLSGDIIVETRIDKPHEKVFSVNAKEAGQVQLQTFSFPGWKIYREDTEIPYTSDNKLKLITVSLPEGSYTLKAVLTDTLPRILGNTLTILGGIGVIYMFYRGLKKTK